ncbi:MAG: radical SAM protein [bacterium]|nr:radical SAM protein [bacterium]
MKILLIDPPFQRFMGYYRFYFPLGLTYLAAVLRQAGHEVLIYDAEHDPKCYSLSMKATAFSHRHYLEALQNNAHYIWQEYLNILEKFMPDIVGISFLTPKVGSALKLAQLTKQHRSDIIVVAGGEHVTVRPQDALGKNVDYVVCGEGEQSISTLVQQISEGKQAPAVIKSQLIEALDTIPLPALDCLHADSYRPTDMGLLISARGCPFNCGFCALSVVWGCRVRYHSVSRVIQEIVLRKDRYGTEYFSFRNGTFTLNQRRVAGICQLLIERQLRVKWECLTRVGHFNDALLELMKAAGCDRIRIGIESGSPRILHYMNKNITLTQIRESAEMLHRNGIVWSAYFMLGVPVETEESIQETLALIREIEPPFVTLARFSPLPGTPMYKEVVECGLLDENTTDWSWAANQSMDRAFVKDMNQARFLSLMHEASQFVEEYNKKHEAVHADIRLKT